MRHIGWVADEFLLENGFTIEDPGPGQRRSATRNGLGFDLEPRCLCEYCPAPEHPNYRLASHGWVMTP